MAKDRPPPSTFVDRTLDLTFPLDGDSYDILWREAGLFPVDMSDMPVALGPERQFFIDDYLIATAHNIRRTVHQPRKYEANPLVVPDKAWEGNRGSIIGPVWRDPQTGQFRMLYRTHQGRFPLADGNVAREALLYAQSSDGIEWTKPELGLHPWQGSAANNILGPQMQAHSLLYEPDDPDPARRYKALMVTREPRGKSKGVFNLGTSPDGISWTKHPAAIALMSGRPAAGFRGKQVGLGDTNSLLFDAKLGRYVWHTKVFVGGKRARAMLESDALVHWTAPRVVLCADQLDPPDAQLYDMHPLPYESLWIAPLRVYRWHEFKQVEIQLAHSRDGRHYARTADRQVFLPLGAEDAWDADYNICANPFFVDMGDELWIYYTGSRHPDRGYDEWQHRIGLAVLPRDRFVSIDGAENAGIVVTRPLDLAGHYLHLNAAAARGRIRVAVLDEQGRAIPGLGLDDCIPLAEDALDVQVAWKGRDALDVQGRLRLQFELREAALFSFWIN